MTATAYAEADDWTAHLEAAFPGWRIWASRPRGLLWATRRGNIHYHDERRPPGWSITVGGVPTRSELRAHLAEQRQLDNGPDPPEPPPDPAL